MTAGNKLFLVLLSAKNCSVCSFTVDISPVYDLEKLCRSLGFFLIVSVSSLILDPKNSMELPIRSTQEDHRTQSTFPFPALNPGNISR